jgi:hypothetical protein
VVYCRGGGGGDEEHKLKISLSMIIKTASPVLVTHIQTGSTITFNSNSQAAKYLKISDKTVAKYVYNKKQQAISEYYLISEPK